MIKLLIGGSPCTYWSIAQKNNRETEPSGMGWELFKNYLIAKEKFKPDYFLYENNKSAAKAIKDEIKKQFGVWDGTFCMEDTGARYIEINSALVSAQNRQRFYVHNCGEVGQPEDRGILLKDILESGTGWTDKSHAMTASYNGAVAWNTLERHQRTMVAEPVPVNDIDGKSCTIRATCYKDGIRNLVGNNIDRKTCVAEPVRVGDMGSKAQGMRVYAIDGKSVCLSSNGGGLGAKTGLYAIPSKSPEKYLGEKMVGYAYKEGTKNFKQRVKILGDKACPLTTEQNKRAGTTNYIPQNVETVECEITTDGTKENAKPIYEVKDGKITIKGKEYPIKLADGFYIIRKLTVKECCRLQGMPDWWFLDNEGNKILSDSQAYKGLGNGWQLDTVKYILEHGLKNVPRNEELIVLSLYDGIATGRRILEELGFTKVKYYAYEIDKCCIKLTSYRYPDIIHCGDAFQVRNKNWEIK